MGFIINVNCTAYMHKCGKYSLCHDIRNFPLHNFLYHGIPSGVHINFVIYMGWLFYTYIHVYVRIITLMQ